MEQQIPTPNPTPPLLSWRAPDIHHHKRSPRWYAIGGACVLLGATYGILTGAWTLSVVVILIGGMYFLIRNASPELKHIEITEQGVIFDNVFTNWNDCISFWIIQNPDFTELHIHRENKEKDIVIQTGNVDPLLIRQTLSNFLQEESDRAEGTLDTITRMLKL